MPGHTLLLSDDWDVSLDASGRIAQAFDAYAVAQNVANAVRLFTDDACFDRRRGLPHFETSLGRRPSLPVLRARARRAALNVDGVADAEVTFLAADDRVLRGDIRLTLDSGETAGVAL